MKALRAPDSITLDDVIAARKRIQKDVSRTPLIRIDGVGNGDSLDIGKTLKGEVPVVAEVSPAGMSNQRGPPCAGSKGFDTCSDVGSRRRARVVGHIVRGGCGHPRTKRAAEPCSCRAGC